MAEVEKQESQKTVVAFITGLLIGGLLVWVFSSTPDEAKNLMENTGDTTEEKADTNTDDTSAGTQGGTNVTSGQGSITVADQKAGEVIALGAVKFPTDDGWVVVRDYMDGTPGNILGAARYDISGGLVPAEVELIRSTTSGSSYQVVFYTSEGAIGFMSGEDKPISGIATTFKAN
jgi:hypothetical protein